MFEDTIAAISTGLSDGAISIIRLSGDQAVEIADSLFDKDLKKAKSHTITYGTLLYNGKPLDEVLVSVFKAPKTYTREDVVEINSHGGVYITQKILEALIEKGARLARPGEFTQRAFLNGRIDLSQAESVQEIIDASNDSSVSLAIAGIKGSVRALIEPLIDELLEIVAQIEVNIDYPEYDLEQLTYQSLLPKAKALLDKMDHLIATASRNQLYKKGIDTVIVGKPNVGKSSLLNALLEEEKAIVTDVAGTTRDLVEGTIRVGNTQLNLIDTAGIRESKDQIEQIGIEKSKAKIEQADLILLVLDGSGPLEDYDFQLLEATKGKKRIVLSNKSDLSALGHEQADLVISAKSGDLEPLFKALEKLFQTDNVSPSNSLTSVRQISLLKSARADMMKAIESMEEQWEPDLIEIDLVAALEHLKEILGRSSRDDLLDTLFSRFCLGK